MHASRRQDAITQVGCARQPEPSEEDKAACRRQNIDVMHYSYGCLLEQDEAGGAASTVCSIQMVACRRRTRRAGLLHHRAFVRQHSVRMRHLTSRRRASLETDRRVDQIATRMHRHASLQLPAVDLVGETGWLAQVYSGTRGDTYGALP